MKVNDAIAAYLENLDARGSSNRHIKTEEWSLKRLSKQLGDVPLSELDRLTISRFLRPLRETSLATASVSGIRRSVKAVLRFCYENRWTSEHLGDHIKVGSFTADRDKSAPEEHIQAVLEAIPRYLRQNRTMTAKRDALTVSLSIDSGARLGELNRLTRKEAKRALANPRFVNGHAIYQATSKGKRGGAVVRFTEETAELMRLWLEETLHIESEWVFCSTRSAGRATVGAKIQPTSQTRAFERICDFAGVPRFRSHAVRHTNIGNLLKSGADPTIASSYAGHSSIRVTLTHYRHAKNSEVDAAAAAMASSRRQPKKGDQLAQHFFKPKD